MSNSGASSASGGSASGVQPTGPTLGTHHSNREGFVRRGEAVGREVVARLRPVLLEGREAVRHSPHLGREARNPAHPVHLNGTLARTPDPRLRWTGTYYDSPDRQRSM